MPKDFMTGYLDDALVDLAGVIERAVVDLADVDFDTLVGTGLSGALVVPALALRLGKHFVLVRKPSEETHHAERLVGTLGERWLFVDDFVSMGRTRQRVVDEIFASSLAGREATYVGDYLYADRRSDETVRGFNPAWVVPTPEVSEESDTCCADCTVSAATTEVSRNPASTTFADQASLRAALGKADAFKYRFPTVGAQDYDGA